MRISFCITCKNRLHQISKTLLQNLSDNKIDQNKVEFILVDFNSTDGLKEWVVDNFQRELSSGYLKFYTTDKLLSWHASVAKNTAHFFATNDVVVNLDCDNYTGKRGGEFVISQFKNFGPNLLLHQYSGSLFDGSFGRISIMKDSFHAVGGYDESLDPMGYQDTDLIHRLVSYGLKLVNVPNSLFNRAIANTKQESIKFTNSTKTYREMNQENRKRSIQNLRNGKIIANNGVYGLAHQFQLFK